jgi:hypothetical protein
VTARDAGAAFEDHVGGPDLGTGVWVPHHLPHRSSRAESAVDFPEKAVPGEPYVEPELVVDRIRGAPPG